MKTRYIFLTVFGYGLYISNHRPLFSEREGWVKRTRIFGYKFEWITP